MAIDERIREELLASTAHLLPDLDTELSGVLGRARRRHQWRVAGALAVVAATAAVGVWSAGALTRPDAVGPADERPRETVVLNTRPVDEPLAPGTYTMWFLGSAHTNGPWAQFDVPAGFTFDGSNLSAGSGLDTRNLNFGTVAEVSPDFCRTTQHWVDAGDTVQDLADALSAMAYMNPTAPVRVELDGHQGLYDEQRLPPTFEGCRRGKLYGHVGSVRTDDGIVSREYAGQTIHQWIVEVEGHRYVVATTYGSGVTQEQVQQLDEIARSITFVDPPA